MVAGPGWEQRRAEDLDSGCILWEPTGSVAALVASHEIWSQG